MNTRPDFKTRRTIAVIASIVALIILAFHTRCSETKSVMASETATFLSGSKAQLLVKKDDTGFPDAGMTARPEPPLTENQAPLHKEHIEYLLLLGVDRALGHAGRTDAIMIAALNHGTGHIGVISVPRDLYVDIPSLGQERINAVFRLGNRELGPGNGLAVLKRVIDKELGVPITHTVMVDFRGFAAVVDTIGGIDVDVKCPIEDCFMNGETDAGCTPLSLTAGVHRLNGRTALLYARSRHGRTDSDRSRRQQAVMLGVKKRLSHPGILPKLPKLWIELSRYIATDLDVGDMLRIASFAAAADKSAVHGLVLKSPIIEQRRTKDGKEVVELNPKELRAAMARLFSAPAPGTRRSKAVCPAADVGLHWRERLRDRKGKTPPPLVSSAR